MKVLVVGGAGRVGAMVGPALRTQHEVRVADLGRGRGPREHGHRGADPEVTPVDVTDIASVRAAVAGQDAVVYLAMGQQAPWGAAGGWAESHFDVNVKGLYLTLRAAAEGGVRTAIYASSLSIYEDYLDRGRNLESIEPDAVDGYGLSKRLGEQVCAAAAREHGMSVVALRLCGPMPDDQWRAFDGRCPDVMTAGSDVGAAFLAALQHQRSGFDAFVITGDGDERFISQTHTRTVLGWRPRMTRAVHG